MHTVSLCHSPWPFPAICRIPSAILFKPKCYQSLASSSGFLPLSPKDCPYLASDPPVQVREDTASLGYAKIVDPPSGDWHKQLLDIVRQLTASQLLGETLYFIF